MDHSILTLYMHFSVAFEGGREKNGTGSLKRNERAGEEKGAWCAPPSPISNKEGEGVHWT
jgi:hypothetical protein